MGAHPGGLYTGDVPVDGYGEDYDFWVDARAATRAPTSTTRGSGTGCSTSRRRSSGSSVSAPSGSRRLRAKADPNRGSADAAAHPPDLDAPVNAWERAAVLGARHLADARRRDGAHAVLAGAGVANLAAWLGVQIARDAGSDVKLTAEIGLWDYDADARRSVRAQPSQLPDRDDARPTRQFVLGALVGGPGTDDDRLSRRRAGRPVRQHQLDAGSRPARSSSARAAATTSRAPRPRT